MTTSELRERLKLAWRSFDRLPLRWCGRSKQWELVKAERKLLAHAEQLEAENKRLSEALVECEAKGTVTVKRIARAALEGGQDDPT